MPVPRISVVVPFHNNGDVLGDCLKSIAAQSFADLEVIMVDDGSVDNGAEVAAAQAAADPRFRLIQVNGGSPGFSRNEGIKHATGEYLSFVDGDDALPSHALERLLVTRWRNRARTSSPAPCSGSARPGSRLSALHAKAIKTRKIGTHISVSPELFFDVSVWNKLFRRSFWDANHLIFPEGVVWEDLQLMTKAHVLARAVDVIPDFIYYWRERGSGALSITQSRTSIENFRDRITALLVIDEFLREHKPSRMEREHQRKALLNDLWLYIPDLGRTTEAYRTEFLDLMGAYLAQIDKRVIRQLPSTHKLAYHLIARRMMPELLELSGYLSEQPVRTVQVVRERGRVWADLPFRKEHGKKIPSRIYRTQMRELDPFVRVEGHRLGERQAGHLRLRLRPVHRHPQAAAYLEDRDPAPAAAGAAAGDRGGEVVPAPGSQAVVGAAPLRLRLGRVPGRDRPPVVPRRRPVADRRLGWLRAGARPRRLAHVPAAHPDQGIG